MGSGPCATHVPGLSCLCLCGRGDSLSGSSEPGWHPHTAASLSTPGGLRSTSVRRASWTVCSADDSGTESLPGGRARSVLRPSKSHTNSGSGLRLTSTCTGSEVDVQDERTSDTWAWAGSTGESLGRWRRRLGRRRCVGRLRGRLLHPHHIQCPGGRDSRKPGVGRTLKAIRGGSFFGREGGPRDRLGCWQALTRWSSRPQRKHPTGRWCRRRCSSLTSWSSILSSWRLNSGPGWVAIIISTTRSISRSPWSLVSPSLAQSIFCSAPGVLVSLTPNFKKMCLLNTLLWLRQLWAG